MASLSEEVLAVSWVELYRTQYIGGQRDQIYTGPLFLTRVRSSSDEHNLQLEVGPVEIQLSKSTRCLEAAQGVVLLGTDDPSFFYCIAVGMSTADQECLLHLHKHLQMSCSYQVCTSYDDAATELGVVDEDPKLLGLSSRKLGDGVRWGARGLAQGINSTGKTIGSGISKGADWMVDKGLFPPARKESNIAPAVKNTVVTTSKVTERVRSGVLWVIEGTVNGIVSGAQYTATAVSKTTGGTIGKSQPVRALAHIGAQSINGALDIYDALEDAAGEICKSSANATTKIVQHRHGPEAASVTKHVFDATGSVVSTALGFRLYRRPEVKASQQGEVQEDKAVQGMALLDLPANASSRIQEVELPGQTREDGAAENGSLRDGKDTAAAQSASDDDNQASCAGELPGGLAASAASKSGHATAPSMDLLSFDEEEMIPQTHDADPLRDLNWDSEDAPLNCATRLNQSDQQRAVHSGPHSVPFGQEHTLVEYHTH